MRRRGIRGLRRPSPNRAFELINQHKLLALRDLRSLERPEGTPEWVELGTGLVDGNLVALAVGRRSGVELIGFARVAAALARESDPLAEAVVLAPFVSAQMRSVAEWMATRGFSLRLVAWPVLAERAEDLIEVEHYPQRARSFVSSPASGTLGRVVRVVEGAAAVTCAGEVRHVGDDCVLYMRGARILRIASEGEGVGVYFLEPEKRQIHVNEGNFPRWGPELHEQIVSLAQDPRLLGSSAARENASDASARAAGARVTARWMPWNEDGSEPIDWVGVDAAGRPAFGFLRERLRVADVPAILAALCRMSREAEVWTPGAHGRPRLFVAGQSLPDLARDLLDDLGVEVEVGQRIEEARSAALPERERERGDREGRGRRRSRRRRRGRRDDGMANGERPGVGGIAVAGGDADFDDAGEAGEWEAADERDAGRGERESLHDAGEPDEDEIESSYEARASALERADDGEGDLEGEDDADVEEEGRGFESERGRECEPEAELSADEASAETEGSGEDADGDSEADSGDGDGEPLEASDPSAERMAPPSPASVEAEGDGGEEIEIGESPDAEEIAAAQTAELRAAVRRRRPKAAIAVRNDTDSILAALVLARERRNVPFFYTCAQHELMDFLRGKATDIDDATDLLLVGFTAQPVPSETIAAAQVYRGPLCWFDHHEWPIEDLERLREAIGPESVFVVDSASSPLAAVVDVAERRSRFTDKLLDFSARRLSENDMQKWGYRLAGAIARMARTSGDHRNEIQAILAGKPSELPAAEDVYAAEELWMKTHEPRVVCFGEYQMAVGIVPEELDAGEVGRRLRLLTGARLSLSSRAGDSVVLVGYNEEKRHMNVQGMLEQLQAKVSWLHARPSGDRIGRVEIDDLAQHPERIEAMIGEIVRHKSVLYG